jgi:hypothetical protein
MEWGFVANAPMNTTRHYTCDSGHPGAFHTTSTATDDYFSRKHDSGKPDYTLLPLTELEGVVRVLEFGQEKYARDSWKQTPDGYRRYLAAAMRHLADELSKDDIDIESGLPVIDHAITDLIFARWFKHQ